MLFGKPLTALGVVGILSIVFIFFRNKLLPNKQNQLEILIILIPFLAYFCGHSFLFWKGAGGSGGATRVMASIAPLAVLLAMRGLKLIIDLVRRRSPVLAYPVLIVALIFTVSIPTKVYVIPVKDFKDH